jgi:hypothetical protein
LQKLSVEGVEKYLFLKKKVDIWWCSKAAPPYIQYILSGKVLYKYPHPLGVKDAPLFMYFFAIRMKMRKQSPPLDDGGI